MEDKKENKSRRPDDESTSLAVPRPSMFEDFMRPLDQLMEPFFSDSLRSFWTESTGMQPVIDLQDRGDHYLLTAELPGFDKKEVEVRIDTNVLELKAERSSEEERKNKGTTSSRKSHTYFRRIVNLPEEVLAEKVNGTMKNGVLELRLPKSAPRLTGRSRRVDLK